MTLPHERDDPDFEGLLRGVEERVQGILSACDRHHWNPLEDARAAFPRRALSIGRGVAVVWRGLKERAKEGLFFSGYTIPHPFHCDNPDTAAAAILWWGFLATWYGNYEAFLVDLAQALGVPLSEEGKRRWARVVAYDLADLVLSGDAQRAFKTHLNLCHALRNTIHNGGVHDPRGETIRVDHRGEVVTFLPGRPPEVARPGRPYDWILWFDEALGHWHALIESEPVKEVRLVPTTQEGLVL